MKINASLFLAQRIADLIAEAGLDDAGQRATLQIVHELLPVPGATLSIESLIRDQEANFILADNGLVIRREALPLGKREDMGFK